MNIKTIFLFLCFSLSISLLQGELQNSKVKLGIDTLIESKVHLLKGKKLGVIINHSSVNAKLETSLSLFLEHGNVTAIFTPEHGFDGVARASEKVRNTVGPNDIPIYSLHGEHRRPTKAMLKNVDTLIFDIQDIGSRSYTYISTLFYAMDEAARENIDFIVLDRPNPLGGITVDGPMLDEEQRSFLGYINIPYCHGMTIGELAQYYNNEYHIGCKLTVVSMQGWKRKMTFEETGLLWIPTSPYIPEKDTPFFYPAGILGELKIVSIGIGYTLPFKVAGAPWVNADIFAKHLNKQGFPGVYFSPFHFRPFYGRYKGEDCHGVRIFITDPHKYLPVSTQYLIMGILKSLYPQEFKAALSAASAKVKKILAKVNGTEEVFNIITTKKYIVWLLKNLHHEEREAYKKRRQKYLLYD